MKKYLLTTVLPFTAGMVFAINLMHLLNALNNQYDAQWWKVALAVIFGLGAPFIYNIGNRE